MNKYKLEGCIYCDLYKAVLVFYSDLGFNIRRMYDRFYSLLQTS